MLINMIVQLNTLKTINYLMVFAEGQHVISRVETKLSDGSTKISNNLTPETAQLLTKLHPNMFPPDSLSEVCSGLNRLKIKLINKKYAYV